MALISKHKIKLLKLFLVSPTLEKFFLILYVVTVPLLALSNKFGNNFSGYYLGKQMMNIIYENQIRSITTTDELADWITKSLTSSYFTNKTTITKPLFPIFLFKSQLQNDSCDGQTTIDLSSECSFIVENLQSTSAKTLIINNKKGNYGSYPISDYLAIPREISYSDLDILNTNLKNNWIDASTTFLSVQSISYNDWDQTYIEFVVTFEWDVQGKIGFKNIAYDISYPGSMSGPFFVAIFILFAIQLIIFIMKVLFEFSISPNRYTFTGHLIHFALQAVFALLFAITLQDDKVNTHYSDSLQSFIDAETSIKNITLANILLNLIAIFYPFRLFTFLAWYKYLSTPIKLFVVLYRTIPGMIFFGLGFVILWVCFSLASFMGLREFVLQLQSYQNSFLNYFQIDYGQIATSDYVLNSSKKVQFQITWAIHNISLSILFLFAIAIIIDLIKRSFDHELPAGLPHQQELQDKQTELYTKFEKFLKELTSIFGLKNKDSRNASSFSSEEKMVIWLEHKMGHDSEVDDVIEQLSREPIKIMVFYKPEEVEEFLKYLFRLKPNLLTSQAGSKFRIVFETKFERVNTEKNNIETLLDWLKGVGCRVPFLLFTKAELEKETYIHMKKKYPAMFATEDKLGALKFCRMEGKLENLGFKVENNGNKYIVLENSVSDISAEMTSRSSLE